MGVTSYVSGRGCNAKVPTVFTSTGDYNGWIRSSISRLPAEADLQNTALPYFYRAPSVTGTPSVGNHLACDPGDWTENTESLQYQWRWVGREDVWSTDATYLVEEADLGEQVICTVIAYSDAGSNPGDSEAFTIPAS